MESATFIQQLNTALNVLALVGIVAGIFVYFRYRVTSETVKLYQTNQAAFETRITELERQHVDNQLEITALKTKVGVLETLPLTDIAANLKQLLETQNTILSTQSAILQHLQTTPTASAVTINTPSATASTQAS